MLPKRRFLLSVCLGNGNTLVFSGTDPRRSLCPLLPDSPPVGRPDSRFLPVSACVGHSGVSSKMRTVANFLAAGRSNCRVMSAALCRVSLGRSTFEQTSLKPQPCSVKMSFGSALVTQSVFPRLILSQGRADKH